MGNHHVLGPNNRADPACLDTISIEDSFAS